MPNYDEAKLALFPAIPFNIHKRMQPMQLLLVMKHFRPDELERFVVFFIRKAFKNLSIDLPKAPIDTHLAEEWACRPTLFIHSELQKSIYEDLELKATRYEFDL